MKKDEMYKYGKILCCVAVGLAVAAVIVKKTMVNKGMCIDDCSSEEE